MSVKLVATTKINADYLQSLNTDLDLNDCERLMVYIARVSSPNPLNESYKKLLKYCLDKGHWSVFESVNMVVEIETTRAISAQILRHRSFTFQEFSQRYSEVSDCEFVEARLQDVSNRQNSFETSDNEIIDWWNQAQSKSYKASLSLYHEAIENGIAKETARFLLPMSSKTKLYMNGTVRSWIHYIQTRATVETQKEHRILAEEIKNIFTKQFPVLSEALGWM